MSPRSKICLAVGSLLLAAVSVSSAALTRVSEVPPQQSAAPTFHEIQLIAHKAVPSEILIKTGESVQFNSKDGKDHNIDSGKGDAYGESHDHDGSGVESGAFGPDEGYRILFSKAGIYYFHDHFDPEIAITIAVYDASGTK